MVLILMCKYSDTNVKKAYPLCRSATVRDLLLVAGIIRQSHGFCGAGISLPKRIGCCDEQVCSVLGCQSRKVGRALNLKNNFQKNED